MSDSIWPGGDPQRGNAEIEALRPLCDVRAKHTSAPQDCLLGIWEGYGLIDGGSAMVFVPAASDQTGGVRELPGAFSRDAPKPALWGRRYFVFPGPLATAIEMSCRWDQPPNSICPSDGSDASLTASSDKINIVPPAA